MIVLSILLSSCTSSKVVHHADVTNLPPLHVPSKCYINWVLDEKRSAEVPDCVINGLVDHKQAAEYTKAASDTEDKIISKVETAWGWVVAGIATAWLAVKTFFTSLLF